MAIQRWDPLRDLMDLQERVKQLFDGVLSRSAASGSAELMGDAGWNPPMDLHEDDERYVLLVDLPGVAAADVELKIEDAVLFLRGERKPDSDVAREAYLRIERPHGRFASQISLPPSVDPGEIQASHRNGVVEVVLPKKKRSAPSRIPVTADGDTG